MRLTNKIMAFAAAVAVVATGCVDENPNYKPNNTGNGGGSEYTGYLDMASFQAQVMPDTELQPQSTRADEALVEVDGSYIVTIFDRLMAPVFGPVAYSELANQTDNMIELAVGNYYLEVKSSDEAEPVSKTDGFYSTDTYVDFSVARTNTKDNPAKITNEVVCKLQSVKVTVELTADLLDPSKGNLTEYKATVGVKDKPEATVDFTAEYIGLNSPAFLDLANRNGENTLDFVLTGKKDGEPATLRRSIEGVKKGEWRKIIVSIAYNSKGEIIFDVKVSTLVQDNEITVNSTGGNWTEPVLSEGTDLGIVWEDHDLATDVFNVSDINYDADNGSFTGDAPKLKLLAKNGIKSVLLTVTTTCADFGDVVEDVDLCGALASIKPTMYRQLRIAEANATEAVLDMNKIMENFYGMIGEYTFTFKLTDMQEKTATSVFRMVYGAAEDPSVTCREFAFDTNFTITSMAQTINIDIQSSTGITKFFVDINMTGVSDDVLNGIVGGKSFDLCNIEEGSKLEENLPTLGFPINDEVEGKISMLFSLTKFVPMMSTFYGTHEFTLTIENAGGLSVTKKLILTIPDGGLQ